MKSILLFTYLILLSTVAQAWPPGLIADIMLQANRSIPVQNLSDPNGVFQHYRAVLVELRKLEDGRDQSMEFFLNDAKNTGSRRDLDFSKRLLFEAQTALNQFRLEQNLPRDQKADGLIPPNSKPSNKKKYTEIRNGLLQALNYNLVRHHRTHFFDGDRQGDFLNYLNDVYKKELTEVLARNGVEVTHSFVSNIERQIGRIQATYLFYIESKTNADFQEIIKGLLEIESHHNLRVDLHGFWKSLWIDFKVRTDRFRDFVYLKTADVRQRIQSIVESRKTEQLAQMCIQLFQ